MRIIAGQYGGRKLETPKNQNIRPTSDKIRGAIFSALDARGLLQDSIVLDAFCGSGALGLEALSRGSEHVTFIDKDKTSLNLAKTNSKALNCEERCNFILKDSTKLEHKPENVKAHTLVFMDPPYSKNMVKPTLDALISGGWVTEDAFFVVECNRREEPDLLPLNIENEKIYGDTKIVFAYKTPP